ncbi:MAG: hypothetical protein HYV03_04250, partial [Deltaproteobacteria bacterium]|nr:hypothetical protein [Deltaproteobacteria bacterium]
MTSYTQMKQFLCLFAFLCLASVITSTANATTIPVNSQNDIIKNDDGLCTLREAVIAANKNTKSGSVSGECRGGNNTNDTIVLGAGTYKLTIAGADGEALVGDLDVIGSVSIQGAGLDKTTIDVGGLERAFDVHGPGVVLQLNQLTIANGKAGSEPGGAIRTDATDQFLFLNEVRVASNSAKVGGAIYSKAMLNLFQCQLADNTAEKGGAIYHLSGQADVSESTFSNNAATGTEVLRGGGGIYNSGTLTVNDSVFKKNTAAKEGGGIASEGTLTVFLNTFDQNKATSGAGIHAKGSVTIQRSSFSINVSPLDGGTGGAIAVDAASTTSLESTSIYTNAASYGGGVYNAGNVQIQNTSFLSNIVFNKGG